MYLITEKKGLQSNKETLNNCMEASYIPPEYMRMKDAARKFYEGARAEQY